MTNAVPWWANSLLSTMLAVMVAWLAISFDRRKTVNQELIRKRIAIYDQMAPMLNDLFCFFRSVGAWNNLTPPVMIDHKRALDRIVHVYGPLFSRKLTARYDRFIDLAFATYQGFGEPPRLKASLVRIREEWGESWQAGWDARFVETPEQSSPYEFGQAYYALMNQFAVEIGARRDHWFAGRLSSWPAARPSSSG